jgi:hypothetical protein
MKRHFQRALALGLLLVTSVYMPTSASAATATTAWASNGPAKWCPIRFPGTPVVIMYGPCS